MFETFMIVSNTINLLLAVYAVKQRNFTVQVARHKLEKGKK